MEHKKDIYFRVLFNYWCSETVTHWGIGRHTNSQFGALYLHGTSWWGNNTYVTILDQSWRMWNIAVFQSGIIEWPLSMLWIWFMYIYPQRFDIISLQNDLSIDYHRHPILMVEPPTWIKMPLSPPNSWYIIGYCPIEVINKLQSSQDIDRMLAFWTYLIRGRIHHTDKKRTLK